MMSFMMSFMRSFNLICKMYDKYVETVAKQPTGFAKYGIIYYNIP
jgi:hypothetical protein